MSCQDSPPLHKSTQTQILYSITSSPEFVHSFVFLLMTQRRETLCTHSKKHAHNSCHRQAHTGTHASSPKGLHAQPCLMVHTLPRYTQAGVALPGTHPAWHSASCLALSSTLTQPLSHRDSHFCTLSPLTRDRHSTHSCTVTHTTLYKQAVT